MELLTNNTPILLITLISILPILELKGSIPLIISWGTTNAQIYWPFIILSLAANILSIFFIYLFLDYFHHKLINIKAYRAFWKRIVEKRMRKKMKKLEQQGVFMQYFLLFLFVVIPLPGTGIWMSTLIAWSLGLNRKKSILSKYDSQNIKRK
jgi:uncharacterized membrane protein